MLVLNRKTNDKVTIYVAPSTKATVIQITVLDFHNPNRARLGFDAPDSVTIIRNELLERMEPDARPNTLDSPV